MLYKNYILAVLAGLLVGVLLIPVLANLKVVIPYGNFLFITAWPLLFVIGVFVGKLVAKKLLWFWQLVKFAEVGFLNTAIDFGVLNLLIFITGTAAGFGFVVFKTTSFIVANINSYFWNRWWVFEASTHTSGKEYAQFLAVSLIAIAINVGVASLVVNFIPVQLGLSPEIWANIGAALGMASGLLWNFFGYKFFVFYSNNK